MLGDPMYIFVSKFFFALLFGSQKFIPLWNFLFNMIQIWIDFDTGGKKRYSQQPRFYLMLRKVENSRSMTWVTLFLNCTEKIFSILLQIFEDYISNSWRIISVPCSWQIPQRILENFSPNLCFWAFSKLQNFHLLNLLCRHYPVIAQLSI